MEDLIEEESSRWSLQNIQWINTVLGVSFDRLEERAMELLKEIEKRREENVKKERLKVKGKNKQG